MMDRYRHTRLMHYARMLGPEGVFVRYVLQRCPYKSSPAVISDDVVQALSVTGRAFGLYEVYPHWTFAGNRESALRLATVLADESPPINFPLEYQDVFAAAFPELSMSVDNVYLCPASQITRCDDALYRQIYRLRTTQLRRLDIPDELLPMIGSFDDWDAGTRLYGLVEDNELHCIGEVTVSDGTTSAIQQVYTVEHQRGRGLARRMVRALASLNSACDQSSLYITSETNHASCAVASSLGLRLYTRRGELGEG